MAEEAEATSVSPNAQKYILDRSTFYYQALTTQAKINAYLREDDMVLPSHAHDANRGFFHRVRGSSRMREAIITLSGLVVGVGVPQLLSELSRDGGPRIEWSLFYMFLSVAGSVLLLAYFVNIPGRPR